MHIVFVSDVYFPRINGVSTSIQTFAHQFQKRGHRVTLIAPEYPEPWTDDLDILRVPSRYLLLDNEDRWMKGGAIRRMMSQIRETNPDLVHVHTPFIAHYEGLRLARSLDVPLVISYHTYFEEYLENYLPFLPPKMLRFLARRFSASQCRQADGLVVPSGPMLEVLRSYEIKTEAHVVPTGIPAEQFASGNGEIFRNQHGIPLDRRMIVYVGRVAHEKNLYFLLDVVEQARKRLPNILLVLAGEGPARSSLQRRVSQRALTQHVSFVGYLSRETELAHCYAAADIFVFASRTETQGLVLLEAMAAGTPVVTTAVMGTADVMGDELGGLVAPEDSHVFAEKVCSVLEDENLRNKLSSQARAKAQAWSDDTLAEKMLRLYTQLIPESGNIASDPNPA